jgi:Domain of unknown function (DUF4349)
MSKFMILAFFALIAMACSSGNYASSPQYKSYSGGAGNEGRMVIQNSSMKMVVPNPDTLNNRLVEIAKKYGGYVVALGTEQSTIRVSAGQLDNALQEIGKQGKLKYQYISGTDVTDEFKDYEIRLDNATKARQRYLELLEKAENVEAALKVEKELERLNGEIDLLKGKMGRLTHLAEFSTIEIDIEQKQKIGVLGYVFVGLYKSVKWLFVRG